MPFDKAAFAKHLSDNAQAASTGKCARYVREALEAGGLNTSARPVSAKDYGPFLVGLGFMEQGAQAYVATQGDIVVLPGNASSAHGHIAGYDGSIWISDFKQSDMYGGPAFRKAGTYKIYRYP